MIRLALLWVLLSPAQQPPFNQFSYCRANSSGSFESLCIQLNPAGAGEVRFKRRDDDELRFPITLSPGGTSQFLKVVAGTKYLANAKSYESKRKVADLGRKHLILEIGAERREADFNFSEMKDVSALVDFFEALLTQETLVVDMQWAMKFDNLGVPDRLDQMEKMVAQHRLADPKSMIDVLDLVSSNEDIVNYARTHARELKEKIVSGK
jgi:hypothetical protein